MGKTKTREELIAERLLRRGYQPERDDAEVDVTTGTAIGAIAGREVDDLIERLRLEGSADEIADRDIFSPAMTLTDEGGGLGLGELPEEVWRVRGVRLEGWEATATPEPGPPPPCPNPYLRPGPRSPRAWVAGERLWVAPLTGAVALLRAVTTEDMPRITPYYIRERDDEK